MNAVVTGAGSGVGQAVTLALAKLGWRVALVGRREEKLRETIAQAGAFAFALIPYPCDVAKLDAVEAMAERVRRELGEVDVLVNAAGTNAPNRALAVLSADDYHAMINTNLNGAFYCVRAFLGGMRARGLGTIVNVVSDAGKQASPKAGPAYVASKFALAGLTQSINAEERGNGIRACAVFPGDIDTPLLEKRPQPPDAGTRRRMLQPADVAACVLHCIQQPPHVIIEELLVRPR